MYEEFFALKTKPFELVPNPDFLYLSRSHKKAITYLEYGIKEKVGFILLTGEIGSGKTTILRNLIKNLNDEVSLSKIFNTRVNFEQLLAMINEDFGLEAAGKDKITLIRELNDFLVDQYARQRQCILIIDEAQNLSLDLLEEVRLLSNLETDRHKLLQIIMVGQPELRKMLTRTELQQLRQRISISCHIQPLSTVEVRAYIYHRLETAGNREAILFSDETVEMVCRFSKGIPRLINIICDYLMLAAYVEGVRELNIELVREVIGEIEAENRYWSERSLEDVIYLDNAMVVGDIPGKNEHREDEISAGITANPDLTSIADKLTRLEKLLNDSVSSIVSSSDQNEERINVLQTQIKEINNKIGKIAVKPAPEPEKEKKNRWSWIFG
jgi:general secretion pathway protein A